MLIFFAFLVRLAGEPRSPGLFFSGWFLVNDSVSSRHAGLFRCCFPSRLSLCRQCVSGNLSISPLFSDLLFPGVSPWYRLSRLFSHCWFYLFPSSVFCGECCIIGPFPRACCTLVPARGRILEPSVHPAKRRAGRVPWGGADGSDLRGSAQADPALGASCVCPAAGSQGPPPATVGSGQAVPRAALRVGETHRASGVPLSRFGGPWAAP